MHSVTVLYNRFIIVHLKTEFVDGIISYCIALMVHNCTTHLHDVLMYVDVTALLNIPISSINLHSAASII